jgi:hypothetical protein
MTGGRVLSRFFLENYWGTFLMRTSGWVLFHEVWCASSLMRTGGEFSDEDW